jgi:replication factor C subunit 3/5
VTEVLSELATRGDFPHLLFYGPLGSGKKTRVYCFLNQIFGSGVYKLKSEEKIIKLENSSTVVECFVVSSNYHMEICPADCENNDRHVVQNMIKEAASSQNIESKGKSNTFKVIIINDADKLTKEAQAALRRTM